MVLGVWLWIGQKDYSSGREKSRMIRYRHALINFCCSLAFWNIPSGATLTVSLRSPTDTLISTSELIPSDSRNVLELYVSITIYSRIFEGIQICSPLAMHT